MAERSDDASAQQSALADSSTELIAASVRRKAIRKQKLDNKELVPWGATYVPNRNRMGIEAAQKLIFVQQNDPATYKER